MKKLIFTAFVILGCHVSYAETCPSVHDIKNHLISDWAAYDSDSDKPLTTKETDHFASHIAQFALAEWTGNAQKGNVHCFYRDLDGSTLEAYLSKQNYYPNMYNHRWYQVSGHLHCAAGLDKCIFNAPEKDPHKRLATS